MLASIGGGASTGGGLSAAGVPSDIFMLRLFRRDAPASRPAGAARDRGLLTEDRDLGVLQALAEASRVSRRWRRKARYSIRSGAPTWQLLPGSALPPGPCDVVDPPVPRRPVLRTSRRPHSSADLLWTTTSAPSGAGCPRSGRRAAHARCISKRPDAALSAVGCGSGTLACARSGRRQVWILRTCGRPVVPTTHPCRPICRSPSCRADRLLSIVLLLQSRGRHTANQLATELAGRRSPRAQRRAIRPRRCDPPRTAGVHLDVLIENLPHVEQSD